jgi:anti-sigma factor ChrR (cupin superfamily)
VKPLIVDSAALAWRDFPEAPGVRFKVLRHHEERRGITLLLQFDPGAHYPTHRHPAGEEYYVLDGSLRDGAQSYGAGAYVYHAPGSMHRPASPGGCVLLVMLPAHIEVVDG